MKAFIVTIIIILSVCLGQNTAIDSLNTPHKTSGFDKIKHAAVSCLLTLSNQYIMEKKAGFDENKALPYSVSSAAMVGLVKELNDAQTKEKPFDWGDLIADGVGIAIAIFIITYN